MTSLRRELLNQKLNALAASVSGDVLDIGGKRGHTKGSYQPPIDQARTWKYLNPDTTAKPDYLGSLGEVLVPEASFDRVFLLEVLEYLPEPHKAFEQIYRYLRPGGTLVFSSPLLFPIHGDPDKDRVRWNQNALRDFVTQAGFQLERLEPLGALGAVLHDVLYVATSYSSPGYLKSRRLHWLHRALGLFQPAFRLIDKLTAAHRTYLTTGYFVVCRKP